MKSCGDVRMTGSLLLCIVLTAAASAAAAPSQLEQILDDKPVVESKRAALVLDRLLVALQNALRQDSGSGAWETRDGGALLPSEKVEGVSPPAALRARIAYDDYIPPAVVLTDEVGRTTDLQRRGNSGGGRGRVLRCYFNAVTCFRK